jgi:hypothetical protein
MRYIKVNEDQTTTYPYTLDKLKREFPNVSFPNKPSEELLEEYNVFVVNTQSMPAINPSTQKCVEIEPEYIEGKWEQRWDIIYFTPEEIAEQTQQIQKRIVDEVQKRLDDFAASRGYDGILSACTYFESTIEKFKQEGLRAKLLRDQTWATCYQILEEATQGLRPTPTSYYDIEQDLPELTW